MSVRSVLGRKGLMSPAPHKVSRIVTFEGPRGLSMRSSVYLRHVAYFLIIVLCSAVSDFCFRSVGQYAIGGKLMFAMCVLVMMVAAAGTAFYTNQREEIIEQARHYVFGLMLLPGTALALIMWAAQSMAGTSQEASSDQFMHIMMIGLPMVYFGSVILPPVLFVKMLTGMHNLHRSRLDDEELVAIWTRQDGHQV